MLLRPSILFLTAEDSSTFSCVLGSLKYAVRNVHQQVWVALGSVSIIAFCAYPVFRVDERPGHDLFSSEKPEAVVELQESQRKEYRRLMKEHRKQQEADQEAFRQRQLQLQQQQK